jgi:hypothetical protein
MFHVGTFFIHLHCRIFFYHGDGGSGSLRSSGNYLTDCTASHVKKQQYSRHHLLPKWTRTQWRTTFTPSTLYVCNKALVLQDLLVFHFPTDPVWAPLDRRFLIVIIIIITDTILVSRISRVETRRGLLMLRAGYELRAQRPLRKNIETPASPCDVCICRVSLMTLHQLPRFHDEPGAEAGPCIRNKKQATQ